VGIKDLFFYPASTLHYRTCSAVLVLLMLLLSSPLWR